MNISTINKNYPPSFYGKKEKNKGCAQSMKYILPALLLLNSAQIKTQQNSDIFECKKDTAECKLCDSSLLASTLNLDFKDDVIRQSLTGKVIILDPGHGGTNKTKTETSNPYGAKFYDYKEKKWHYEKDLTLDMSKSIEKYLKQFGANVIATRDSDEYVPRIKRAEIAKENKADIFVSIHVNSNTSQKPHGPTIHKLPSAIKGNKESTDIAKIANAKMATVYEEKPQRLWENDFTVLEETKKIPGILVETGYLSNPKDRKLLLSPEHRDKTAKAIAASIIEFFVKKNQPVETLFMAEKKN